ncbi:MAG: type I-E CRISPR-associated protein Cas6/Cse3/CasE [Sutterellaceae bacterium]|nr:type I-E CRISPR-associated protein Cas6/Cse3/CasE [Burkholderiaceae bacterium]MDW8430038.1 type I-E CRISPR-associated protein Cas6/Cse3/CasE [Sutterellaceae bacterium]
MPVEVKSLSQSPLPPRRFATQKHFVHSRLSFTRLDIPEVEVFETAVSFPADIDPLSAHDALASVFGQKAGFGQFLFRADSETPGRFWVRSAEPWTRWPEGALSALEPRRRVIQLAEGLMYHFSLTVCAGDELPAENEKRVAPYETTERVLHWLHQQAPLFGFRPLIVNAAMAALRFSHRGQRYRVPYARIDGALQVAHAERLRRRILKGFGYYRRTGIGMLELSA